MDFPAALRSYDAYLRFERGLADNTRAAYGSDLTLFAKHVQDTAPQAGPGEISAEQLADYLAEIDRTEQLSAYTRARKLAALRSFYRFLRGENIVSDDPTARLDSPKLQRPIPTVLSVAEVDAMLETCDPTTDLGLRNRAMLEVLYSAGLRVSELIGLQTNHIYPEDGFLRVVGKGDKERLVPVGNSALAKLQLYHQAVRLHATPKPNGRGIVFLNRSGGRLTRQMLFHIVRQAAKAAGIDRPVGPHTLRHCFATHLLEGGADLAALQAMLGHASITTTEIYLHLDKTFVQAEYRAHHPRA